MNARFPLRPMKTSPLLLACTLASAMLSSADRTDASVTAAGVVPIDAESTPGTILETAGTVDLALNFGANSGATINGIAFTGAPLTVGTPVAGSGATLTPTAPTPAETTLRNLDLNGFLWSASGDFAGVMNDLVDSSRFPAVAGDALNFTISGLNANRYYFIQLLSGDTRAEFENQNYTLGGVVQNAQFGNGGTDDGVLVKYTASGETTLNLSVSNVTGNSPPMIAGILIRSVEPGLFASPSASSTSDGTPSTLSVQVVNGASVSHNITGISFSGPNAGDFGNGTTLPLTVPALGSANVTVNVNPAAGGARTATLNLTTTDLAVPTLNVALSVNVLDPIVSIGSTLDFGNSPTLPAPISDVIFVDNDGGSTGLTVSSPVLTGPGASAFSVTSLPSPIVPGGFDTVEVTFNPSAPGYYAATLQLATNDPFTPTASVQLKGELTGNLIFPITAVGASTELTEFGRAASNTANGSGLTGLGSPGSSHTIGETGLVWTTRGNIFTPNDLAPEVTYDLGAVHQVTRIREWGYNDPTVNLILGTEARIIGPKQVEIFTSTNNATFTSAGIVNFALAPGTSGYTGNDVPVSLPATRYIRLVIKSNHDGAVFDGTGANPGLTDNRSLTGLSEIRFEGTLVPGSPFEIWLDSFNLTGLDREPDADPDHDGSPNLIEYITGGVPTVSDPQKLPQSKVIGGNLVVSFERPDEVSGAAIRFEAGTNLASWPDLFAVGASPEVTISPNGSAPDTITLTLPLAGKPVRFVRLAAIPTP
jgi:hypothetical protein